MGPLTDPDSDVHVVLVSALESRLASSTPEMLLRELAGSNALLSRPTKGTRCALISYRQERGLMSGAQHPASAAGKSRVSHAELSSLTLDGQALLGAVTAARNAGLDAVWLDAWCYRFDGEYDHHHFCQTLHSVLAGIEAVVWLPRSKVNATGTYGYRLWCTFEAACVERRKLPVHPAGHELSRRQKNLLRFGSYAPALFAADGVTDALCRFNLSFYVCLSVLLVLCIVNFCYASAMLGYISLIGLLIVGPAMFLSLRNQGRLEQERRLAKNAQRVMRLMQAHAVLGRQSIISGRSDSEQQRQQELPHVTLKLNELPWLPAHDRRDVMVIQQLLGQLDAKACKLPGPALHALALSIYVAASFAPALGDGAPRSMSISAWLRERDIVLEEDGQVQSAKRPSSFHHHAHGDANSKLLLSFSELRRLGWRPVHGPFSTCALAVPPGILAMRPPRRLARRDVWDAPSGVLELVAHHQIYRAFTFLLIASTIVWIAIILMILLLRARVVPVWLSVLVGSSGRVVEALVGTYVFAAILHDDGLRLWRRKAPFPVCVGILNSSIWKIWAVVLFMLACAAGSVAHSLTHPHTDRPTHATRFMLVSGT
mmetsp:Transcript_38088/g.99917  ORF Transcript_38088/g.99917 Transcript_38088/m.99917 type:complete len:599 (+) Transcript_38088:61-1857(+)